MNLLQKWETFPVLVYILTCQEIDSFTFIAKSKNTTFIQVKNEYISHQFQYSFSVQLSKIYFCFENPNYAFLQFKWMRNIFVCESVEIFSSSDPGDSWDLARSINSTSLSSQRSQISRLTYAEDSQQWMKTIFKMYNFFKHHMFYCFVIKAFVKWRLLKGIYLAMQQ